MTLIEPCCTQKHWPEILRKAGNGSTTPFHGYGDLSISELFPVLLARYVETDMTMVCPVLPGAAVQVLKKWMEKSRSSADGKERLNVIRSLKLITDLRPKKSGEAAKWLKENPWPGRLTLCDVQQNDTAILLPDFAVFGNVNLAHNGHFVALASTSKGFINSLQQTYAALVSRQ